MSTGTTKSSIGTTGVSNYVKDRLWQTISEIISEVAHDPNCTLFHSSDLASIIQHTINTMPDKTNEIKRWIETYRGQATDAT